MNQKNRRKIQWQKTTVMQTIQTKTHSQKTELSLLIQSHRTAAKIAIRTQQKMQAEMQVKTQTKMQIKTAKSAMSYGGNKNCGKIRDAFDESDKY